MARCRLAVPRLWVHVVGGLWVQAAVLRAPWVVGWVVGGEEGWSWGKVGVLLAHPLLSRAQLSALSAPLGPLPLGTSSLKLPTCLPGLVLLLHPQSWGRLPWAMGGLAGFFLCSTDWGPQRPGFEGQAALGCSLCASDLPATHRLAPPQPLGEA